MLQHITFVLDDWGVIREKERLWLEEKEIYHNQHELEDGEVQDTEEEEEEEEIPCKKARKSAKDNKKPVAKPVRKLFETIFYRYQNILSFTKYIMVLLKILSNSCFYNHLFF